MNRYLVFAGMNYYPSGGWEDLVADYENFDDAKSIAYKAILQSNEDGPDNDWAHIVDTAIEEIVLKLNKVWDKSAGQYKIIEKEIV